jgi:hypothetical protein
MSKLALAVETAPESDPPRARVFISYSCKGMAFADRLDAALKGRGFEPLINQKPTSIGRPGHEGVPTRRIWIDFLLCCNPRSPSASYA